jgi:type I restriction enzyme M protein
VIVLDKENANQRESIYFINASKGFVKDGNKNRLREQDFHKIVDCFTNEIQEKGYAETVSLSTISLEANDYNLNIPRYINSTGPEDIHDLEAHLRGGIPNFDIDSLERYWNQFPSLRAQLFTESSRAGYSEAAIQACEIAGLVNSNQEVASYKNAVNTTLDGWKKAHYSALNNLNSDSNLKELIETLSKALLSKFDNDPLLDKYDVYQKVMEYWVETMQDDAYMVATDGWRVCKEFRVAEKGEDAEFTIKVGKKQVRHLGQVLPASLIIAHFFSDEQINLDSANSNLEQVTQAKQEFEEKHGGDGGDLLELEGSNGKINKGNVQSRVLELKESIMEAFSDSSSEYKQAKYITKSKFGTNEWTSGVDDENGDFSELDKLYEWLRLNEAEETTKKACKAVEAGLMQKVADQYPKLSEEDCKSLLIETKWYAALNQSIDDEINQIIQDLSSRVKMICDRYAYTLSELESKVEEYSQKNEQHLKKMGLEW